MKKLLVVFLALLALTPALSSAQSFVRWIPPPNVVSLYETSTQIVFTKPAVFPSGSVVQVLLPDGTATAPSLAFASESNLGLYRSAAGVISWGQGGFLRGSLANTSLYIASASASINLGGNSVLLTEGNYTLAQRVGTNPQVFNIYNTYTDAGNYERIALKWSANVAYLQTESAGSGSARGLSLGASGNLTLQNFFPTGGSDTGNIGAGTWFWQSAYLSRSIQGSKCKALTGGAATEFVRVAVPQTGLVNFASGEVIWNARASDAVDIQTLQGRSAFNCVNKAGTETCAAIVTALATAVAPSGGAAKDDLACTITAVVGLTDVIGLAANCASVEMTETSLQICYRLDMPQPNTVTPQ